MTKLEIKTRMQLRKEHLSYFPNKKYFDMELQQFVSLDSMKELDIYREIVNKLGKAKVWRLNANELCDEIELLLQGIEEKRKCL